jgi:D-serine deaminase-like pyridoxal phosphate-dependent protein
MGTGGTTHVDRSYEYYRDALTECEFPCAFVDLDRLEANAREIRARADGMPVRVASKSVRCRAVLERILDLDSAFQGLLCYSGQEAGWLAEHGFENLLVAYPVWQERDIVPVCDAIADGTSVVVMVDSQAHVDRLGEIATTHETTIPLCLDLDLSTSHLGIHFGVFRSGIQSPEEALAVADYVAETEGVKLAGLMGYEAQLAGIPDDSPANSRVVNAAIRFLKRRSRPRVRERRVSVVRALDDAGYDLSLVNGGGTGTVEFTTDDPTVTEVTVGSGFYAPALFDYYRRFQHQPAAGFAIEVIRMPRETVYTCRGGGYVASGPPAEDREPEPWFPREAALRDEEGAGEVQTPVLYDGSVDLSPGDPVCLRHAKAGELCEQFERLHLVSDGDIVETVPTYRGDGRCFL